jgi:hypothetical protein
LCTRQREVESNKCTKRESVGKTDERDSGEFFQSSVGWDGLSACRKEESCSISRIRIDLSDDAVVFDQC